MKNLTIIALSAFLALSCTTVDLEEVNETERLSENSESQIFIEHPPRENEVPLILLVESPDVRTSDNQETLQEDVNLLGSDALVQNLKDKKVSPEYMDGRLKGWVYKEDSVYQVLCQTYRSTLIEFEPGEEMLEMPFISESDVWQISRGIGLKDGFPTQYLIIKPDYSNLNSTLIIITNRRVYQMELKSSKTTYMPTVRWIYPQGITNTQSWQEYENEREELLSNASIGVNSAYLSFDYQMTHSVFDNPVWLPTQVYDDGGKTYIVLDERSLLMEYPLVFNEKKDIINYRTQKNIIILDQLIEKITLKLGRDSVKIEKKKTDKDEVEENKEE